MSVSARVNFGDATGRESTADLALARVEQLVATRVGTSSPRGRATPARSASDAPSAERAAPRQDLPGRPTARTP